MSRPAPFVENGEVWAPGDAVSKALGAVLAADGQVFRINGGRASAPRRVVDGREMVSLGPLAEALGAETRLVKNSFSVFGRVTDVRFADGAIRVTTSIPVLYQAHRLTTPERIYIDLKGARIIGQPSESKSATALVRALRLGQYDPDTARITAEMAVRVDYAVQSPARSAQIVLALKDSRPPEPAPAEPPDTACAPTAPGPVSPLPVDIRQVRVENTSDSVRFIISGNAPPKPELKMEALANRLSLAFAGATVSAADRAWRFNGGPVQQAVLTAGGSKPSEVLLTVSGTRPLAANLLAGRTPNEVVWEVSVPTGAEGDWRGKVVVIDAGHGGKDRGASANGLQEKDINLAVALAVKQEAERRGLACALVRSSDAALSLQERVAAAPSGQASLFVSIHANSNGRPNSVSGLEVYYHGQDPSSRMLAQIVHDEITAATGMTARGARSDTRLYKTGLYVLRNAAVPAILVEMGYLNHGTDAKRLADTDFQDDTARAIVDAVIRYLGGPAALDLKGPA